VAGDFNTPTRSAVYRESWTDLTNAFSAAGWGLGHTHFSRRIGVRIDHILASDHWHVTSCEVGPDVGSAHRPVVAELKRPSAPP
jgi:endonuclease/exonuclease/phosphatase (EEP) superfamily protein YafD